MKKLLISLMAVLAFSSFGADTTFQWSKAQNTGTLTYNALNITTSIITSVTITNATLAGTTGITSPTISGSIAYTASSGNVTHNGSLVVNTNLTVSGNAALVNSSGNVTHNGSLVVNTNLTVSGNAALVNSSGNVTHNGNLTVNTNFTFKGTLTVGTQAGWTGVITNKMSLYTNFTWVGNGVITNVTLEGALP